MKVPRINSAETIRNTYISDITTLNRLRNLWGTEVLGDTEVLALRQYYHPESKQTDSYKKLYKFLGAYDSVEESSKKGIESGYVYFNKNAAAILDNTNKFVADNLNLLMWDPADGDVPADLKIVTNIVIEGALQSSPHPNTKYSDLLDPSLSEEQLKVDIRTHYNTLWDTCRISQQGMGLVYKGDKIDPATNISIPDEYQTNTNDPWLWALSVNALRSIGVNCEITKVDIGLRETANYGKFYTYVVTLEIPYRSFSESTNIVVAISEDLDNEEIKNSFIKYNTPNGVIVRNKIKAISSTDIDTGVIRPYIAYEDASSLQDALYSNVWYKYEGKWYLKADALIKPKQFGITRRDMLSYVLSAIDSDYKKESVPWYKKLVAAIIFVAAVVLAPVTGGYSLSWTTFALAIIFASLVLTILAITTAMLGHEQWSGAFAEMNKDIEPLVLIASIITAGNFLQFLTNQAKEFATDEFMEFIGDTFGDNVEMFTRIMNSDLDWSSAQDFLSSLADIVTLYTKNKIEDLSERNKALQDEAEKLQEEGTREMDVISAMIRASTMPATTDWSMYAAQFDMPYERGGGPLAMGNIQRTTKTAMRPGTYDDPVFENILGV